AGAQRLGDARQISQLLADAQPVGGGGFRHLALGRHPRAPAPSGEEMIAALGGRGHDATELRLESIDHRREGARVDEVVVLVLEFPHRREQLLHITIVRNLVRQVQQFYVNLHVLRPPKPSPITPSPQTSTRPFVYPERDTFW